MFLKHELVRDAITKSRPIKNLFRSSLQGLLDDYVVSDYVTTDKIPEARLKSHPEKLDVRSFFDKHRYVMPIRIDEILEHFGFADEYPSHQQFPYEFLVHVFDTFIVLEIFPNTTKTEFLLLSPRSEGEEDALGEIVGGLMAASSVMAFFSGVSREPGAQVAIYIKLGQLLEYLRTGMGKKKRFGLF